MNWSPSYCEAPSTALLILGTLAEERGHTVKLSHLDIDVSFDETLHSFKPDIVGITCNTFQVKSARETAKQAKAYGSKVVIGGPHACAWDGEADEVVVGEGENRWLEILGETANINTADDIPLLHYDLLDMPRFTGISGVGAIPSMCIMASRGCPYSCIFCNTPYFWGRKVRYRSPELVLAEVEYLHKQYGAAEVFFQDDTFNLNHEWAAAIFEGIIARGLNKEMLFRICCRVNEKLFTPEFLELARRAGVWNIFFGVESGSQLMLDTMKKGQTVAEVKRAIRMTKEAHISAECSLVVGLPGETQSTLHETGRVLGELQPDRWGWCHACPFPKTELDRMVTEKGHKQPLDYGDYGYGMPYCRTDALSFDYLGTFKGFNLN